MHTLSVKEIKKYYENKLLLNEISFSVNSDEVLCLLGQSGSGKSTLLRIIAGLESADHGQVLWDYEDITNSPTHLRHFGLMFQDYALFPHKNVAENVAFGLQMQQLPDAEIRSRVKDSLAQVNMGRFSNRMVTELSGGEQQRVALARALAPRPRLLMLDEPLAALDRTLREQLLQELNGLLHQSGIPVIYVTHDQEEALALGDKMALINNGQIEQIGKPEDLYNRPSSVWAANFLGNKNVYSAEVISTHPLKVKTGFGDYFSDSGNGVVFSKGEKIKLVITSIGVSGFAEKGNENLLLGTCQECVFKGDHYRISLRTDDDSMFIFSSNDVFSYGEKIQIKIPPANLICLKSADV